MSPFPSHTGDRRAITARRVLAVLVAALAGVGCVDDSSGGAGVGDEAEIAAAPAGDVEANGSTPAASAIVPEVTAEEGVLVWVHDREPPDLHVDDPDNGTEIANWIREGLLEGLYGVDQNLTYVPELLAGAPVVEHRDDGSVAIAYQLRDGLTWSDGEPLTADDVAYTHRVIVEGCQVESNGSIVDAADDGCVYRSNNRIGYDLITSFDVQDETHFTVSFETFFPGWRGLYNQIYAEHAFGGSADVVNANLEDWQSEDGPLPSSGPLTFSGWEPGLRMDLGVNEQYHGSINPDAVNTGAATVAGVQIVFVGDPGARAQLLTSGEADLVMSHLDPDLGALTASGAVTVAATPSERYELLGMNLLDGHLAKAQVRQAIAYAIDKAAIVSQVYQPLVGDALPAEGLGNTYWVTSQPGYENHQEAFAGAQVEQAEAALQAAGYEKGGDGVYAHPEDGRLSLRAGTTGGNELREQQLELLVEQIRAVGIEVTIESAPGGLFFEQGPFSPEALAASGSGGRQGDSDLWDLAFYSWATGPWPGAVTGAYRSRSGTNPYGFANPAFDDAASKCDANSDDVARAACYGALDTYVTTLDHGEDGLFVIPITQRTHYYAHTAGLASVGVAPGSFHGGPLINVGDHQLAG